MKHEQWQQQGSTILARGEAWVCIMAEPHHSQPRVIEITSPGWDEAMKRAKLIAAAPMLLAALGRIEWVPDTANPDLDACPWCFGLQIDGHTPSCQRQAAIAKATGES